MYVTYTSLVKISDWGCPVRVWLITASAYRPLSAIITLEIACVLKIWCHLLYADFRISGCERHFVCAKWSLYFQFHGLANGHEMPKSVVMVWSWVNMPAPLCQRALMKLMQIRWVYSSKDRYMIMVGYCAVSLQWFNDSILADWWLALIARTFLFQCPSTTRDRRPSPHPSTHLTAYCPPTFYTWQRTVFAVDQIKASEIDVSISLMASACGEIERLNGTALQPQSDPT